MHIHWFEMWKCVCRHMYINPTIQVQKHIKSYKLACVNVCDCVYIYIHIYIADAEDT